MNIGTLRIKILLGKEIIRRRIQQNVKIIMKDKSTIEREIPTENEHNHSKKYYLESTRLEPLKEAFTED